MLMKININCKSITNCSKCIDCIACEECEKCEYCSDCVYCMFCEECNKCSQCTDCKNCYGLFDERNLTNIIKFDDDNYYYEILDNFNVRSICKQENILRNVRIYNGNSHCDNCENCTNCYCCENCTNCNNCYNLKNEDNLTNIIKPDYFSYDDNYYKILDTSFEMKNVYGLHFSIKYISIDSLDKIICYENSTCNNCIECSNCKKCVECSNCTKCKKCKKCKKCLRCKKCEECNNCVKCISCKNCTNCYGLFKKENLKNIIYLFSKYYEILDEDFDIKKCHNDITNIFDTLNKKLRDDLNTCKNCERCYKCENCYNCFNCERCYNCYGLENIICANNVVSFSDGNDYELLDKKFNVKNIDKLKHYKLLKKSKKLLITRK